MYKIYEVENFKFYIKFDLIQGKYHPHMLHRHDVYPEDAITTFFNITQSSYNAKNQRYEAYSKDTNITIYYAYRHQKQEEILLITAIKEVLP
jgi:hypothetical protein